MYQNNQSRAKKLLNKVYDHLDTIDVSTLSIREMTDFLEVVQKGQFLESFGQAPTWAFGSSAPGFNQVSPPKHSSQTDEASTAE